LKQMLQFVDQRGRVDKPPLLPGVGTVEVPVSPRLDPTIPDPQVMPRANHVDALKRGPRLAGREEAKKMVDSPWLGLRFNHSGGQQGLDLRGPKQPAVALGGVQGKNPHPVPAQQQHPVAPVPECYAELAPRPLEDPLAMVLVQVDPEFSVATGGQVVPADSQLLAQLGIVEQLAVERNPDRFVLV